MKPKGKRIAIFAGSVLLVILAASAWMYSGRLQAWYRFWQQFESIGQNSFGLPEYRHRETGIVMVRVPGGTFWMGSSDEEIEQVIGNEVKNVDKDVRDDYIKFISSEQPRHEVFLSPFLISKNELTQAQWDMVMATNPSHFKGDNLPVERTTWADCQEFCMKTGLMLPTEAQWEFACCAHSSGSYSGTGKLVDMSWFKANSKGRTHSVGQKRPNCFGLYDMHGNVWEWCEDVCDLEFYSKPKSLTSNPLCTSGAQNKTADLMHRCIRGGGWNDAAPWCRSKYRGDAGPSWRNNFMGFRPAFYPLP